MGGGGKWRPPCVGCVASKCCVLAQQEYDNGAQLWLGGLESAELACGENHMGIQVIVDCRDGPSLQWDRDRQPHRLPVPDTLKWMQIKASSLSSWVGSDRMEKAYEPIFRALAAGLRVLVFCINGKHRSNKTSTDIVCAGFQDSDRAMNHVWLRRKLVEFTSLPGPDS